MDYLPLPGLVVHTVGLRIHAMFPKLVKLYEDHNKAVGNA